MVIFLEGVTDITESSLLKIIDSLISLKKLSGLGVTCREGKGRAEANNPL